MKEFQITSFDQDIQKKAKLYIDEHMDELEKLIIELCKIPSPSNHEELRADFCKNWFQQVGANEVFIDDAFNVVCKVNCHNNKPKVLFMAHTDTVFPDTEPMPLYKESDKLYCPGVGDNTANLAVLMLCTKFALENFSNGPGMLFVANSGEEGLGNLKGIRKLMEDYGDCIKNVISFDGTYGSICNKAVGSKRYKVEVRTEGGHSFGKFGNCNAIHYLASMISTLYDVKVPQDGGSRTTYNVGIIGGGTSVNTIAEHAYMLYEFRSDSRICLDKMEKLFISVIEAYRNMGVTVNFEVIGQRPCMGDIDANDFERLQKRVAAAAEKATNKAPTFRSSSTDCNIPLSMGIPAVSTGTYLGDFSHTRNEFIYLSSLPAGFQLAMNVIISYLQETF